MRVPNSPHVRLACRFFDAVWSARCVCFSQVSGAFPGPALVHEQLRSKREKEAGNTCGGRTSARMQTLQHHWACNSPFLRILT